MSLISGNTGPGIYSFTFLIDQKIYNSQVFTEVYSDKIGEYHLVSGNIILTTTAAALLCIGSYGANSPGGGASLAFDYRQLNISVQKLT